MYDWSFAGSARAPAAGDPCARACERSDQSRDDLRPLGSRRRAAPRSGSCRCSGCKGSVSRRARTHGRTARRSRAGTPRADRASRAEGRARGRSRAPRSPPRASSRRARRPARPGRATSAASRRSRSAPPAAAQRRCRRRRSSQPRSGRAEPRRERSARSRSRARRPPASRRRPQQPRATSARRAVAVRPFGVGLDDAVAVDEQAHRGPLAVARGVSEALDHLSHGTAKGALRRLPRAPPCRWFPRPSDPGKPGGCRADLTRCASRTRAPYR